MKSFRIINFQHNIKMTKLIITDKGDSSVGLFPEYWEIQSPFDIDTDNISEDEKETLEFFRDKMIEIYKEFCNGKCLAEYDFELKNKY